MDFKNVNSLNVRLNMLSGNLLPMTSEDLLFPVQWRIYSVVVRLIELIQTSAMILGFMFVPKYEILRSGGMISIVVTIQIFVLLARMHAHRDVMRELIQKLNDLLRRDDEIMKSMVYLTLKPIEISLEFYWIAGSGSVFLWCCTPLALVFKKTRFFYNDFGVPTVFTKEPFSREVFVLGNFVISIASTYIFLKKVALDVYTINIVLLTTAQYRYIAAKLATIFRGGTSPNQYDESQKRYCSGVDSVAEEEMRALCQHHNAVIHITVILKKLLSMNMSLIYLNNIFVFCFSDVLIINAVLSGAFLEVFILMLYICGALLQLYILCFCVHQLLDASTEVTEKAFNEKWYQFGPSLKRTFKLMIISNNLECKLSAIGKFNLSLPSFMTILNQSYSIALLLLKLK